ncbi:MAG: sulfurtransferase [Gemmatimonadaceae bacterium]|nr:sulfurtransferase [Gemmatimonadaceae bacterium]
MLPFRATAILASGSLLSMTVGHAQRRAAPATDPASGFVTTPAWLAKHLADQDVVVIEVVDSAGVRRERIPGSREMAYVRMVVRRDGLSTELPSADSLKQLFEGLGISDRTRVVAYAEEAPMATRLLLTLASIGHDNAAYLDGGLPRWKREGYALSTGEPPAPTRGSITVAPRPALIVTSDWLGPRVGTPGLALVDTRTTGEYNGTGNRSGMPSAGHLAGAQQLEWQSLFSSERPLELRRRDDLRRLYATRARPTDTVVTYCWVGYRASATWFAARLLGYDARFYDGSYQDWSQRTLPVRSGGTP